MQGNNSYMMYDISEVSKSLDSAIKADIEKYRKERGLSSLPLQRTPDYLSQLQTSLSGRKQITDLDLSELLDEETLFRFSYVPFVIAELVWDYTDTILDFAAMLSIDSTKKLSRVLHDLRDDYVRYRSKYIDQKHRDSEQKNMLIFESAVKEIFKTFFINLKVDIQRLYPDLSEDSVLYLIAVYQAHITLRALFLYVEKQRERTEKKIGLPIGDILPKHIRALDTAILAYVGDSPASKDFEKLGDTYIRTLANQMALIQLDKNGLSNIV